jgi:hypothetical protein
MTAGLTDADARLVDVVIDHLEIDEPMVRDDMVEAASARLAAGDGPSADDLADTVVAHFA